MDEAEDAGGTLALLDAYEYDLLAPDLLWLDELLPSSSSIAPSDATVTDRSNSNSSNDDDTSSTSCRFKRARQRKKQDLASYRSQVCALEETLRTLRERGMAQSKLALAVRSPSLAAAWGAVARRQEQERREAEALNRQLKRMVDATLRQTRRLQALLLHPVELEALVHHKRLRKQNGGESSLRDSVVLHNLLVTVDVIQAEIDDVLRRFGIHESDDLVVDAHRDSGCGLIVEVLDYRALPYDLAASSASMWRFMAFEDGPADAELLEEGDTTARVYAMDLVNGAFRASYTGRSLYRKRVVGDRVVIVWAEFWTPSPDPAASGGDSAMDFKHESFQREGFACLSRSRSSPSQVSIIQSFYRVKRDACGDASCRMGCCGDVSVDAMVPSVKECAQSEIKRFIQGMENLMLTKNGIGDALPIAVPTVVAQ